MFRGQCTQSLHRGARFPALWTRLSTHDHGRRGRADVSSASVAWPQLALFFVIATTFMLGASHPSLHVYTHARIRWPLRWVCVNVAKRCACVIDQEINITSSMGMDTLPVWRWAVGGVVVFAIFCVFCATRWLLTSVCSCPRACLGRTTMWALGATACALLGLHSSDLDRIRPDWNNRTSHGIAVVVAPPRQQPTPRSVCRPRFLHAVLWVLVPVPCLLCALFKVLRCAVRPRDARFVCATVAAAQK